MLASRSHLVSEEEFLQLPESMTKTELIDGEVISSPAPSANHQEVLARLSFALQLWSRPRHGEVTLLFAPIDIRFGRDKILQPDRLYDRVTKRYIYAEAGVREYWVVEQHGPVERRTGENLDQLDEVWHKLSSPLLPGLDIDLSTVFLK